MKKLSASGAELYQGQTSLFGTHANRPAATDVIPGSLYFESDTGQAFLSNGTIWQGPINPSAQIDYVQSTSNVVISGTTEATATTVLPGNSHTYDGSTKVEIEYFVPDISGPSNDRTGVMAVLFRGTTPLGQVRMAHTFYFGGASDGDAIQHTYAKWIDTPPAGDFVYTLKAFAGQSYTMIAGDGASGNKSPLWMKVSKA